MSKDWTQIQKKYKGLWVALDKDEETVLASGKDLKSTLEKARRLGYRNPSLTRMPESLVTYVGTL